MATPILNLTEVEQSASQKVVVINGTFVEIENAMNGSVGVDTAAATTIDVLSELFNRNFVLRLEGAATGALTVNVPDNPRFFAVDNVSGETASIQVTGGAGVAVSVADGEQTILYSDGTDVQSFAGSGGGGASTFLALTDTPASFVGQAGRVVKVNPGETGFVFADDEDTGGGGGGGQSIYPTFSTPALADYTAFESTALGSSNVVNTDVADPACLEITVNDPPTVDGIAGLELDAYDGTETTFKYTVGMIFNAPSYNFTGGGIYLRESATGRIVCLFASVTTSGHEWDMQSYTSDGNAFDASVGGSSFENAIGTHYDGGLIYIQIEKTALHWLFNISRDGENFSIIGRVDIASDEFTGVPDKLGFALKPNSNAVSSASLRAETTHSVRAFHTSYEET